MATVMESVSSRLSRRASLCLSVSVVISVILSGGGPGKFCVINSVILRGEEGGERKERGSQR